MTDNHIKVPTAELEYLIKSVIALRQSTGDWHNHTASCYRAALKQFVSWYDGNLSKYDSSRLLIHNWILRAKSLKDNEHNYRVIGNLARFIVDLLEIQKYAPTQFTDRHSG